MKTEQEIKSELANFTGTTEWYRHTFGMLYTQGIRYLAEAAEAFWMLDLVESWQFEKSVREQEFQVFKLTVNKDRSAIVSIEDGNDNVIGTQAIEMTFFPLDSITLFYNNVEQILYLPSEH